MAQASQRPELYCSSNNARIKFSEASKASRYQNDPITQSMQMNGSVTCAFLQKVLKSPPHIMPINLKMDFIIKKSGGHLKFQRSLILGQPNSIHLRINIVCFTFKIVFFLRENNRKSTSERVKDSCHPIEHLAFLLAYRKWGQ